MTILILKIKFAKKISVRGHLKRMLHLLTSQVSFRRGSSEQFNDNKQKLNASDHFTLNNENSEWLKFCKFTFKANETNGETDKPLLTKLEKHTTLDTGGF